MFIPDVINTLLMGLIFMVIVVTVIRPFVLHVFTGSLNTEDLQKAAIEAVEYEMMRAAELAEAQRGDRIRFQQLLLQLPDKPKPKPQPVVEPEPEVEVEVTPESAEEEVATQDVDAAVEGAQGDVEATAGEGDAEAAEDAENAEEGLAEGEIEIREGETLAEIKERMKKEQQKAKKPTIPPELLNNANSYEDKVGVVRMVVQTDQNRVAAVIRSMIEIK